MSLNWKTAYKPIGDTVQARKEYVVHGRGFTIGNDVWFDEYSLHLEHHRYWNDVVRHHYGYPKWENNTSWSLYAAQEIDKPCVYWSINGNAMFILQHPKMTTLDEERFELAMKTVESMDPDDDTYIRFEQAGTEQVNPDGSHAESIVEPGIPERVIEYQDIDGIESVK